MKTYLVSILVIAIYVGVLIALFVEFPKTMITGYVMFGLIMYVLMKLAPYDHELWPDLYKK